MAPTYTLGCPKFKETGEWELTNVRENTKPLSCNIDLAIVRSVHQDLGLIFSRTALSL